MKIVCVGDCGIDHYLPSNERLFGGISANFARHARHEFPARDIVYLISAVGSDEGAEIVEAGLETTGIETRISHLDGSTPVQYIEIQPDGERRFVRYDEGVLQNFALQAEDRSLITASDLLVAPVYLQITGLFDALMRIPTVGKVSIDFADFLQHPDFSLLERYIDQIDIGFFGLTSSDDAVIAELRRLAIKHDRLFVVTLGAAGSIALHNFETIQCPAIGIGKVVDTTGAGDAFAAGFLSRYCHGRPISESMHAGARLAANVIQFQGAGFPSRQ